MKKYRNLEKRSGVDTAPYKLKSIKFLSVRLVSEDEIILKQFAVWFERPGVFINQPIKAGDVIDDLQEEAGGRIVKSVRFLAADLKNNLLTIDMEGTFEDGAVEIWSCQKTGAEYVAEVNSYDYVDNRMPLKRKLFDNPNDALILYEETNTVINAYKVPIFKNIPPSIPCYVRGADGTDTLIYAMLDTGATRTLIDPYIAEKFGRLTGNKHSIKTMNGSAGDIDECELDIRFNSAALDDLGTILGSVQHFVYDPDGPAAYHNPAIVFGIDVIMEWNLLVKPGEQAIYIASRVGD